MGPHLRSRKLQELLFDVDVVKAGMNLDKDSLHLYHYLHLTANNCIKLSLPSTVRSRQRVPLLDMFRALFKWEWCEKAEVKHSNWRLEAMTLEQIKLAALSTWSCHLIWAQMRESSSGQAKGFHIHGVYDQLLEYFQRALMNIYASSCQSQTSFELAGATVEIQQGFLILNPSIVRSKALNSKSVVQVRFDNGRDPEEYTTKRVGGKDVLLQKGAERLQEPNLDVSSITQLVVDNRNHIDMQQQKLEDAIHSVLCNPAACPSHILMALGCVDIEISLSKRSLSLPQGLILNRNQIDALRMMLSNSLCAVIGPPGTGKTRVITAAAKVWEQSTTSQGQMLLCAAQQNVAVRHMAEMMVKNNVQGVLLLISQDYYSDRRQEEYKHIDDHIVVSGQSAAAELRAWTTRNKGLAPRILLCTVALIGSSSFYTCVKHRNITYMIIDESSQAAEETLIPSLICLPHLQRLSVLGDPCQLPPFGKAVQSVFDLVARNCEVLTLQLQYRMPRNVADFVSHEFYNSMLRTVMKGGASDHGTSLLWVDVAGSTQVSVGSTSLCNEAEAAAIVKLCKIYGVQEAASPALSSIVLTSTSLSSSTPSLTTLSSSLSSLSLSSSTSSSLPSTSPSSLLTMSTSSVPSSSASSSLRLSSLRCSTAKLVVLTLYEAQRLLISKLLAENEVQGVTVQNVDSFQGQEADIIVVSLVVGARISPFASDRRRACVLLSRAKSMLYIFGNLKALKNCISSNRGSQETIIWRSLALECEKHQWVASAEHFLGA